jgi:hypothetical protein
VTSPVSSTNKTDHHDMTAMLLKMALNTINKHIMSLLTDGYKIISN